MRKRLFLLAMAVQCAAIAFSQEEVRSSSSQYLPAFAKPDVSIAFDVKAEGKRYAPTWGLDQAWINEQNLRKGINHMGKENIGIGRTAFRFTKALVGDTALDASVINTMKQRNKMFDIVSTTLPLTFTADQEAGTDTYYVVNKSADIKHWSAMIDAHVRWMQQNTQHPVAGISPFNEGDYWTTEEGASVLKQNQVAYQLKNNYPACADIPIVGGNTLNNDKALEWYTTGKANYDWGNTHQLAGSFDNFAKFYQQLTQDGKVGYGDEMHNVGETMIGLEYGMTVGIWWGFDSRARGEFCQISRHGVRLAYGEHRTNWTAASVYRHDDGRVKAFLGSSERQAATTDYQFVSTRRPVYYDGYGPVHEFVMEMPGGTGYQTGQTNAERVIDVTWGADVAPGVINGTYKIVNKVSGNLVAINGGMIAMQKEKNVNTQHWNITPISNRIGGDYSFYNIESASNAKIHINVKNFSTYDGEEMLAYQQTTPTSNEQWYLEYAGDGYYYIRNRESALYMAQKTKSNWNNVAVVQRELPMSTDARDLLLWRIIPTTVTYDAVAPAMPQNVLAEARSASVRLSWDANSEKDLEGYMIVRAEKGTDDWNTIARKLTTTYFVDNTCRQGVTYIYKVKAIDLSQNFSALSAEAEATPSGAPSMVARWQMNDNLNDETENMMDAAGSATMSYVAGPRDDMKAVSLTSPKYIQLPYEVANSEELTVAMWVNWRSSSTWQRIFDFGNDTDHYMFLSPKNGSTSKMRFAIKNGDNELSFDAPSALASYQWKHVAVTMGKEKTTLYVDGEEVASSTTITIRPNELAPVLNYLGRSQFVSDPSFVGYLSDVRICNYAADADDVKAMMAGDVPDGVETVEADKESIPTIYGLDGVKRTEPMKGLNIIDGKKIIK